MAGSSFSRSVVAVAVPTGTTTGSAMQRSPALPNAAPREVGDDLVDIGVGHDDAVVLRAAHRLDALAVQAAARIDVVRDVRRADEADRLDRGIIEDCVDRHLVAVNDIEDARRQPRFHHQLREFDGQRRVALAGLEDEGVAAGDGDAEHPHRDHAGEVERRDPRADTERQSHRVDVDARPRALRKLTLDQVRDAAGEFDDFEAALDIALRVGDHLAVFGRQQLGEAFEVALDERLESEQHARAALRVGRRPRRLRGGGVGDGGIEFGSRRKLDARLHAARVGIEDVAEAT